MERQIPDVFNIFALGTPLDVERRRNGVPLPGISRSTEETDPNSYPWSPRYQQQLEKWQDRNSACERPRTYDRFYQKLPGNYHQDACTDRQTDSAISLCSSEENEQATNQGDKKKRRRKGRQSRKELHYSRTLTEHDVRHLERHLSMKRTIRKKIMRDLQQAFVQDPREFTKTTRKREINLKSLNLTGTGQSEPNFLDMLRDSDDSGNGSPTARKNEHKFRSCRERRRRVSSVDSVAVPAPGRPVAARHNLQAELVHAFDRIQLAEPEPDYHQDFERIKVEKKKRSFWQFLTPWRNKSKNDHKPA